MYIHHPDLLSHRYGWRHERTGAEVRRVDEALKTLVAAVTARLGPDLETVIVSDHGMDDTKTFLDFSDLVTHPDFGKKFVVALDSTMVRAIYLDSSGARTVRDRLATVPGRFLTKEDRIRFGIDFPANWYGEDIFLLKEGASIYPNFHSLLRPLSMHAYDPALESQTAFAYAAGATAERAIAEAAAQGPLAMNHLFPVFARTIGV
jgi:predicted AlkP superfamily pyrophosphatase or phosphodiesterase